MLRSYTNHERYLRCHMSGQLLNWTKNMIATIHLTGRGTHPSSIVYATIPRNLLNTSMFVEPCEKRARRGTEVGRRRATSAVPCFDILVYTTFLYRRIRPQGGLSPHFPVPNHSLRRRTIVWGACQASGFLCASGDANACAVWGRSNLLRLCDRAERRPVEDG